MQINVSQQLKESIGSVRNYEVNEAMDIAGGNSSVQGEVSLMRTDRGILAKGTLHTEVEATCSRCLNLFDYPLTLNIEEEYIPSVDIVNGVSLLSPEESGSFTIDENHILDLADAIRQYALLAIPMKPLCREDCAGLCSGCGQNLNQRPCGCPSQAVDSRWADLANLASTDGILVDESKGTE